MMKSLFDLIYLDILNQSSETILLFLRQENYFIIENRFLHEIWTHFENMKW